MNTKPLLLLFLPLAACASSTPALAPVGGGPINRVEERPMVCPTGNDEAMNAYNTALEENITPNDATEAHRRAAALYEKAIALDPNFCDAMDHLGLIYRRQGRIDDAIALYKRSLDIAPQNAVGWMNLGVALRLAHRDEEAIGAYRKLIELDPKDPEGWYGLGQVYMGLARIDEGIEALRKAEAIYIEIQSPYLSDARVLLADGYVAKNDWTTVRDLLEPIYGALEESPEVNLWLGVAYLSPHLKDLEKARVYIEKARELGAEIPPAIWAATHPQ